MGAAWGVTPAIARVQAYLMARQEPLTEREVREALGLSHRAASLALAEAESWGIVERVPEPRRVGRRGPAGTAYLAVGDHWQWFGRVIAERKVREGDPIVAVLEAKEREARRPPWPTIPDDTRARRPARLARRVPRLRPPVRPRGRARPAARAARARTLAAASSDASRTRRSCACSTCSAGSTDEDVLDLVEALSRLSPTRRAARDEADVGGRPDRRPLEAARRGSRVRAPG